MLRITGESPRSHRQQFLRRAVPAAVAWCLSLGALYALRRTAAHPPAWLGLLAASANLVALGGGWAAEQCQAPPRRSRCGGRRVRVAQASGFMGPAAAGFARLAQ